MSVLFVAGAGTDVGKTFVSAGLLRAWRALGVPVDALKPVVSGFDADAPAGTDPARLLVALGREPTTAALARMSPFQYRAPLAPPAAARLEGGRLELDTLIGLCRERMAEAGPDLLLIEGAGGVMSPIAERATALDLAAALGAPVLLVGGSYLGAISHTLTAVEVLRLRGLEVAAVTVSESQEPGGPGLGGTVESLLEFLPEVPIHAIARHADEAAWDGRELASSLLPSR